MGHLPSTQGSIPGIGRSGLKIDEKSARDVAIILYEKFHSDEGIFGHNVMPEDQVPSCVQRGSYEHLMFITLVVSIDYQRDAEQLWKAGRRTFEDSRTGWLFEPQKVVSKPFEEIVSAMGAHGLAKKPRQDAGIWKRVSESFFEDYASNPLSLIEECGFDALRLFHKKFDPRFRRRFPFLSGSKIFPLWIRMLHDNVGIELGNLDKIPIPVDVHICRATFTTGCLKGRYTGTVSGVSPRIDEAWKIVMESIVHPKLKYRLQLDEPLWHLSRFGCRFRKGEFCPKKNHCPVGRFCARGIVDVSSAGIRIDTW